MNRNTIIYPIILIFSFVQSCSTKEDLDPSNSTKPSVETPIGKKFVVRENTSFKNALSQMNGGDTLYVEGGTYADLVLNITRSGEEDKPIIIKAKTPGNVFITGNSSVKITGNHILFDGFYFKDGNRNVSEWKSHGPGLISIYGDFCEIANCMFFDFDQAASSYISTNVDETGNFAKYAYIHHCAFIEKRTLDQVINLNNTPTKIIDGEPAGPMYHRISYCYFSNPKKTGNAGGGIRVGYWRKDYGRCFIDHNLFERQDSEAEIITSKSMENVYYKNTFLNCRGTFNFRHGDRQVAINNYIYSTDTQQEYGGMYIWGSKHVVIGNYFNLKRTLKDRGYAAVSFNCGPEDSEHALAHSLFFADNLFCEINGTSLNLTGLYDRRVDSFGADQVKDPYGIQFFYNVFINSSEKNKYIIDDDRLCAKNQTWVANVYNGVGIASNESVSEFKLDPSLSLMTENHLIKPVGNTSLPKDSISKYIPYHAIEGVDFDFLKNYDSPNNLTPLKREDVGPNWCDKFPGTYADTGIFDKPMYD